MGVVIKTITGNIFGIRTNQIQDCKRSVHQEDQLIWVKYNKGIDQIVYPHIINKQIKKFYEKIKSENNLWRRLDLNQRSSAYEADEITNFSTPLHKSIDLHRLMDFFLNIHN